MNSGNKQAALRHARELKLAYQSREKCTVLLNRVEEVLRVITDVESTQKVDFKMYFFSIHLLLLNVMRIQSFGADHSSLLEEIYNWKKFLSSNPWANKSTLYHQYNYAYPLVAE